MHYDISLPNIPNPTRRHCGQSVPAHVADLSHNAVGVDSIFVRLELLFIRCGQLA